MSKRTWFPRFPLTPVMRVPLLTQLVAILAIAILIGSGGPADAKPKYASIAVDGATGKVVQATNADAKRYPASLTKIMTLFIVFEELEAGRLSLDTRIRISKRAAAQVPSKIGLKPGATIKVKDAILALVTKSANDIAVAVAEHIGGTESKFATRMTRTAQRLGMTRTVFKNASGLPNSGQVTTARDMATLGRMIQIRFPGYYKFFATRNFSYAGRTYRNHNRLLGRVSGVDGIKTGYIRASGFNLVSSLRRDGKHVVAVVIGGSSGKARNAAMERLLAQALRKVKPHRGHAIALARAPMPRTKPAVPQAFAAARAAERPAQQPVQVAAAPQVMPEPTRVAARTNGPLPLIPNGRGGFMVAQASPVPAAATSYAPTPVPAAVAPAQPQAPAVQPVPVPQQNPTYKPGAVLQGDGMPRITIVQPARTVPAQPVATQVVVASPAPAPAPAIQAAAPQQTGAISGDYSIQIGAVDNEKAAHKLLALAQLRAGELLTGRNPFTQTVDKDGTTLWRARFAGFDRNGAKLACEELASKDFGCFPVRN